MRNRTLLLLLTLAVCLCAAAHAARVQDTEILSPSMDKRIPAIIVLPDTETTNHTACPVVYLLHGYSSSPRQTLELLSSELSKATDTYQMIVVLPDGGYNSWYFDSPLQPTRKYETFIGTELVRFIDEHYPTIRSRWARALTGGSMGGHGALFIGLRHKEVFGSVGSLSGGVDFRPFPDNWDLKQTLGPINEFPQRWNEHVVINNLGGLKPGELTLYVDVGAEDLFLQVNRVLHKRLLEMHIPHVYVERPGHHDDPYWKTAVFYQLAFIGETFKSAKAAEIKASGK